MADLSIDKTAQPVTVFNDQSGNQLIVNADGSLNSTPVGTATVNMTSSAARLCGHVTVDNALTIDGSTGRSLVMKTGTLVTTAVTADQVILTYTVTAGKTLYLEYFNCGGGLTAVSPTAILLGTWSLESPAGTKLFTIRNMNPTTSDIAYEGAEFSSPLPIAAGTVIRIVCTPGATASRTWVGNLGGYEL